MPLKNTSPALMTIFRFSAFICSAAGYLALNVKCFRVPLGNINCFLFCSVFFFFVCFFCLFVCFFFFWFFVTYNLAGEKATYLKCGRFDVACSRRKLRSRHYLYFYVY